MVVRPLLSGLIGTTAFIVGVATQSPAQAQAGTREAQIVIDAQTNQVLFESNAQAARRPASITKVMTLYLLFDALQKGDITWDDRIVFSRNAANQPPTKLFVGAGNSIPVQTAVEALVLRSANDVATAVAERLGGSESNFAQMMTSKARELGMSSTTFRNASGLPNATQRTTAEDLARLAIAIHRDFPDQYHWFSAQQMSWNGQIITGHNHLMKRVAGMDGLKTGYTNASGFNLAATTQRSGRRIVTVVLGGSNRFVRDDLVEALTESAFQELGIGATQFAANATAYDVNFRDERDAADAAALFMDLPPRAVTMGGLASIAMNRSGRRIGFERGAPTFQVADMTRRPDASRVISGRGTQLAQRDDNEGGATDEGESDVQIGRPTPNIVASPRPVPPSAPFRVAVAASAIPTAAPTRPAASVVGASVPVLFANTPQVTTTAPNASPNAPTGATAVRVIPRTVEPQATPLRQMAQIDVPAPAAAPSVATEAVSAPETNSQQPDGQTVPLRGSLDAGNGSQPNPVNPEASSPQLQPTQMAELLSPSNQPTSTPTPVPDAQPAATEAQVVTPAPTATPAPEIPQATQMAELASQDSASLASVTPEATPSKDSNELNGSINLADASAPGATNTPVSREQAAPSSQTTEAAPVQMAALELSAVAQAQQRQAEASAREQARIVDAQAIEDARREAARVQAAAAARALAERQANERRVERQLAEARAKSLKEKEAKDLLVAQRLAVAERAAAARDEELRQAEATRARTARGNTVVQVGAFKDKKDANAAIAQFSRFFPTFARTEVSSVSRRDGVWYRARFAGFGTMAASEACRLVSGRGGACEIIGR